MKPRNKIQPLPFVLPALFVYILTVIIPILWSMGYSLFSWNGIGDMKFIGLENYVFSKMLSVQPQGLVCYVMEKLGMEPIALLANSHTALITITLIDGYKYCGLYMIIFYSAFVSISKDVIEASTMDGCNVFQQYRYIKLPLVKNIFSIVIVMLVNGCLKTFDVFYILDNKSRSTEMVATYMYKTAFNSADFGYGSTLSVFLVIECLVAVGIIQKCLGSAKGDGSE